MSKKRVRIVINALSLILAFGFAFGAGNCERRPAWTPRIISAKHPIELARASAVVVVGTVTSTALRGPIVPVLDNGGVRLQRVDLAVETVLKGEADSSRLSFYRYSWYADWILESPAIDPIKPGETSVFFLDRRVDDGLTASLDVTLSRVRILSGTHDYASLSAKPIEEQIAYLMLTPGLNVSPEVFGEGLSLQALDAMTLVGQARTLQLLKPLLNHPSEVIRSEACLTMARWLDGQSKCLSNLPSRGTGRFSPQAIRTVIEENELRDASLREKLQKGDIQALERIVMGHNAAGVCDLLQATTNHQDPEIAKLASSLLEKEFPDAVRSGCPAIF